MSSLVNKEKISDTGEQSVRESKVAEESPVAETSDSGGAEGGQTVEAAETSDVDEPTDAEATDVATSDDVEASADPAEIEVNGSIEPAEVESSDDAVEVEVEESVDDVYSDEARDTDEEPADDELQDEAHPAGDAAYAHAPTSAESHFFAEDDYDVEDAERSDFLWWLLTPLSVLLFAPLFAVGTTFLVALIDTGYPAICQDAALDNGCEEVVLSMATEHTIAFGIGWLALWALPWRRRLRPYRIALAVVVVLILLAVPLRLLATVDYHV